MSPMLRLAVRCVAVALLAQAFPGCTNPSAKHVETTSWVLSQVEVDPSLVKNAGSIPVFRRADLAAFNAPPQAYGDIQKSDDGQYVVRVKFREPVVGLSGSTAVQEYEIVNLVGRKDDSGKMIEDQRTMRRTVPLGTVTEVVILDDSGTRLRLQPATNGTLLPYTFTFEASLAYQRIVTIPQI